MKFVVVISRTLTKYHVPHYGYVQTVDEAMQQCPPLVVGECYFWAHPNMCAFCISNILESWQQKPTQQGTFADMRALMETYLRFSI